MNKWNPYIYMGCAFTLSTQTLDLSDGALVSCIHTIWPISPSSDNWSHITVAKEIEESWHGHPNICLFIKTHVAGLNKITHHRFVCMPEVTNTLLHHKIATFLQKYLQTPSPLPLIHFLSPELMDSAKPFGAEPLMPFNPPLCVWAFCLLITPKHIFPPASTNKVTDETEECEGKSRRIED